MTTYGEMSNEQLIAALFEVGKPNDLCFEAAIRLETAIEEMERLVQELNRLRAANEGSARGEDPGRRS